MAHSGCVLEFVPEQDMSGLSSAGFPCRVHVGNRVFPSAGKSRAGRKKGRMHEPASQERYALRLAFLLPNQSGKGPVNDVGPF